MRKIAIVLLSVVLVAGNGCGKAQNVSVESEQSTVSVTESAESQAISEGTSETERVTETETAEENEPGQENVGEEPLDNGNEEVAQSQVSDWLNTLYERYDQNSGIDSVRECFVSGTSDDEIYSVLYKIDAASGHETTNIDIVANDADGFIAEIYGYDLEDKSDLSGGSFGFTSSDGVLLYSPDVYSHFACGNCGGSGVILTGNTTCAICGGSGQQYIPDAVYDNIMGWQGIWQVCAGCGGAGNAPSYSQCSACQGWGICL